MESKVKKPVEGVAQPPVAESLNPCHHTGMNKTTDMKNKFQSLIEDSAFVSAIQGLQSFILDNNADCDMAYDWVCDQAECHSFVCDKEAWDMFYGMFDSTQGLDD